MRTKSVAIFAFLILVISFAQAASEKVLYTFTGGLDGGQPYAGLISDQSGNFYGVTESGGAYNKGTVFELSPSGNGWTETVLYSFTGGSDGGNPLGDLAMDVSGNLYGTAVEGGDPSAQCGTVFELSPSQGAWTFAVARTFLGGPKDGCAPLAGVSFDAVDRLQYVTTAGGAYNVGAAYGQEMASFGVNRGGDPSGTVNNWGFGTAFNGGAHNAGTVYFLNFQCNDAQPEKGGCAESIVPKHAFSGGKGGANPSGSLWGTLVGGLAVMYGTTSNGGKYGNGTVYQLNQNQKGGIGFSSLYSFSGADGMSPSAGLVADAAGNLYGTTTWGGTNPGYDGTVFKLTPGVGKKDKVIWNLTTLYSFSGGDDGGEIYSGLVMDSAGNLYGTTVSGGSHNQGVVYEIIP
ncbi:MAG: choice-of-anchor tandem repeat GloVer-containing protein [Terriglobales bacterium]